MIKRLFLITLLVVSGVVGQLNAQPGSGPGGGGPPGSVPITGIEILLAAGGVLGIKRIMGFNRKSKNP